MIAAVTVLCISFFPPPVMKRIFPPWIAGLCVFVGGVNLIGVGIGVRLLPEFMPLSLSLSLSLYLTLLAHPPKTVVS